MSTGQARNAKHAAEDTATETKKLGQQKVGQAQDKASELGQTAQDKAGEASQTAEDKALEAKDKTGTFLEQTGAKVVETLESAKSAIMGEKK